MIRQLTADDVTINVTPEPEYTSPEDDLSFKNTGVDHSEAIRKIRKRLNLGQAWAWCTVRVSVSWNGYEASDYLGCCTYSNAQDFIKNSGYYETMLSDALAELNSKVSASYATLATLEVIS